MDSGKTSAVEEQLRIELTVFRQLAQDGRDVVEPTTEADVVGEVESGELRGGDPHVPGGHNVLLTRQRRHAAALYEAQTDAADIAVGDMRVDGYLKDLRTLVGSTVQLRPG